MSTRTLLVRAVVALLLVTSSMGLLTACGHGGAIAGAAVGATVGAAVGSEIDDANRYHDPYYYYATGPTEYANTW